MISRFLSKLKKWSHCKRCHGQKKIPMGLSEALLCIEKCSTCNGTGKRFFIKRILYSCFVLTSIISSCLMLAWCALFYHDLAFGLAIITIWMGGYIAYDMWRVSEDKKKNRVAELQQRQQRERVRLKDEFEKIRLRVDQLIHTESPSRLKH